MVIETGVRELREQLSAHLRRVEAGETIVITRHGKPIGRIVPVAEDLAARLHALQQTGLIAWEGEAALPPLAPVATAIEGQSVADLLIEDRDAE